MDVYPVVWDKDFFRVSQDDDRGIRPENAIISALFIQKMQISYRYSSIKSRLMTNIRPKNAKLRIAGLADQ